jgi:hypothetical protein
MPVRHSRTCSDLKLSLLPAADSGYFTVIDNAVFSVQDGTDAV